MDTKKKEKHRRRKHMSVRSRVSGTAERPRLCVYRSLKHIYAQVIDDGGGRTLAAASTLEKEMRQKLTRPKSSDAAKLVGELLARRALELGIRQVVFDRSWFRYHGRIKALADAARAGGLKF